MSVPIRAMTLSEILDQSFKLLRSQFALLVAIAAVLYVPMSVLPALFLDFEPGTVPGPSFWITYAVILLIALVGLPWSQLAITWAISESALGRTCTFGDAYGETQSRYLPYVGTWLLASLGIVVGMFLLILPGIYLAVLWMPVGAVVVIDGLSGPAALGRSRDLVSGSWWRAFGVALVAGIITTVVGGGFNWMFGFIPVVGPLLNGLVGAVTFAFYAVVVVVLYFDLRCRHEDFDLQLLADAIGSEVDSRPVGAL